MMPRPRTAAINQKRKTAMTNTVTEYRPVHHGRVLAAEKEMIRAMSVIGMKGGKMREVVTARWWRSRSRSASVVYATIWVNAQDGGCSGHGKAGGGGYHKESAALGVAIRNAGITLASPIEARGDGAIDDAMRAIALHLGYEDVLLVRHG